MKNVTKLLTRSMLLIVLSIMLFAKVGLAIDNFVQIGTGNTGYTTSWPFYSLYADSRAQIIYLKSEMGTLQAGPITKIAFYNTTTGGFPLANWNIRMQHTTMTNNTSAFVEGGWTTVYSSPNFSFAGTGWQIITLTTPFVWDGLSNIVMEFCHDNADAVWGGSWYVTYNTTADYKLIYAYTDYGTGCTLAAQYISTARSDIQFYQPGGTLNGTVTSAITGLPLAGVNVAGAGGSANTIANGTYSVPVYAGTNNFTATLAGYVPQTKSATVPVNGTATLNFSLSPIPATVNGHISNAANGAMLTGAKVEAWTTAATPVKVAETYSLAGGFYTVDIFPGGSYKLKVMKTGFQDSTTAAMTLVINTTTTKDIALIELTPKPSQPFIAALNAAQNAVNLNWGVPAGDYELIYDDGQQETSTVWAVEGNMNAVKFTALNYPATLIGGKVNIGPKDDYPTGTTIADVKPFTIQVYDASGTAGVPGNAVGSPVTITPANFGWNSFTIPSIPFLAGNFYLVMIQAGHPNPPNPVAARLGVDNTTTSLRSFSKFVTGNGTWLPANGNFMIRAVVTGSGGPIDLPEGIIGYQVYRLQQTQEANPLLWTSIASPTATNTVDNGWPSLGDGAWRWAVKAKYTGNRWSDYTFSNVLGKNWTAAVTVNVGLTCSVTPMAGTTVKLTNTAPGVDSVYTKVTDATGKVFFPKVWKGTYQVKASRDGYATYTGTVTIMGDMTVSVDLLINKMAPTNPVVDPFSLLFTWSPPKPTTFLINDDFSGGFAAQGWVNQGYWVQSTANGNPPPSAEFNWLSMVVNYSYSLTSKSFTGPGTADFKLKYDIMLNDYAYDGNEQMDVELQVGAGAWTSIKHYANTADMPWTTETFDFAAYTNSTFKIRFNAHGADVFNIDNWDVDNVKLISTVPDPKPCILAYNVTLNGMVETVTTDTFCIINSGHVSYGGVYTACVQAVYGSGYSSPPTCTGPWTSKFLCPPTQLTGTPIENVAYLTWKKPACAGGGPTPQWIKWDDGVNFDAIGTGAAANFDVAARWTPAQINALAGGAVTKLKFFPSSSGAGTYRLRIWEGPLAATLLVDQPLTGLTIGAWNTVNVASPVPIDITKELWVGYNINATSGWPAGCDAGPAIVGYGDMMFFGGAWVSMYTAYGLNYNWNVEAWVEPAKDAPVQPAIVNNTPYSSNGTLSASGVQNTSYTGTPSAPLLPSAGPTLLGYNITRNGVPLPLINNPNTLEYYDANLDPGLYTYLVSGYYDVTPFVPSHANSMPAGPVDVLINYGRPIPFFEPWDMGTFAFNSWTAAANWSVNTGFGNPAPTADFSWQPAATNYDLSIETPVLSAAAYTCATVYVDFDLKLIDHNANGKELLDVDLFTNGAWSNADTYANNGSFEWTGKHVKITKALGKAFKVRFRAHGEDSHNILHWYVDNIHVYAVCTPPTTLVNYNVADNDVYLSWTPPNCKQGPPATWLTWDDGTNVDAIGLTAGGTWDYAARWDASMIAALDGGSVTKVRYWPNDNGTYKLRVWQGADAANLVYEQTLTPTIGDWNEVTLTSPVAVDVTQELWVGINVNHAAGSYPAGMDGGPNMAGYGLLGNLGAGWEDLSSYGFDDNWDIEVLIETAKDASKPVVLNQTPFHNANTQLAASGIKNTNSPRSVHPYAPKASSLQGYNIYRSDDNKVTYNKVNTAVVTDTTYVDMDVAYKTGYYYYYVTSVFTECNSDSSNVVPVQVVIGIDPMSAGKISIYPNPASDNVLVKSDYTITNLEVLNYIGQTVYTKQNIASKTQKVNVANLTEGIYFVKVTTTEGTKTVKITVTR